jgi:hypothetical protein
MNKIFNWLTGDLFQKVGDSIDKLITSDEERLKLRNDLQKILFEQSQKSEELRASIINTEAKGNFLQRSWRPILMLAFGFIVVYSKFIAPAFGLPNTELEPSFWSLLNLGIGGYVIGRSAEKITKTYTEKK